MDFGICGVPPVLLSANARSGQGDLATRALDSLAAEIDQSQTWSLYARAALDKGGSPPALHGNLPDVLRHFRN